MGVFGSMDFSISETQKPGTVPGLCDCPRSLVPGSWDCLQRPRVLTPGVLFLTFRDPKAGDSLGTLGLYRKPGAVPGRWTVSKTHIAPTPQSLFLNLRDPIKPGTVPEAQYSPGRWDCPKDLEFKQHGDYISISDPKAWDSPGTFGLSQRPRVLTQ